MNVVYPPTLDHDFMHQRPQQLMEQIADHGHRVFFCNKTQQRGRDSEEVRPNLIVVHDHEQFVRKVIPTLEAPLVWCSWSKLHDTLDQYRPSFVVYDCLDDFPDWRPYEAAMIKQANAVVCSARALYTRITQEHPRVALVPNGCDFDFFQEKSTGTEPRDLPPGRGRRAGFIGAWGSWIDTDLVERTARALPHWQFIIIGPPFGGRIAKGQNIFFLGMRSYRELPAYLHRFDVALIPFVDNQVTQSANPIKLWEYLASGRPVVATPLPEVLPYRNLVRIGTARNFAQQIQAALTDTHLKKHRVELAKANSWESRYQAIARFIPQLRPVQPFERR